MDTQQRIRDVALRIERLRDRGLIKRELSTDELASELFANAVELYSIAHAANKTPTTVKPLTDKSAAADVRNAITHLQQSITRAKNHGLTIWLSGGNIILSEGLEAVIRREL